MAKFLWQNHGCGYHRPGQCAATRFVNSGDTDDTEGAQFFFRNENRSAGTSRQKIISISRIGEAAKCEW